MLKELMQNQPVTQNVSMQNFNQVFNAELISLINEKCGVNFLQRREMLTLLEMSQIVDTMHEIYIKILSSQIATPETKIIIANSIMARLFDLWQNSYSPELFFAKIQQKFTPAQIVAGFSVYFSTWEKYKTVMKFFTDNKQIFPRSNKKIRTIGLYYFRIYNGGTERFLSMIIPIYIQLGYRVVLFTDEFKPELEYKIVSPTPPRSQMAFVRENFKTPRNQTLARLTEWAELLKKYDVDLMIIQSVVLQSYISHLFFRLSGIKVITQLHASLKNVGEFRFPNLMSYPIADAVVVISKTRMEFLKNYGVKSFYIPNSMMIENADKFQGRDLKKFSNTVIWIGRIDPQWKNPFAVVPIMKEVAAKIPNAKLKIVGGTDIPAAVEKLVALIKENHLENNIEICGYHTDVAPFYKAADVMLNTSPNEGWSLVIAEGKFYELPLVLYELPDNELISDGKGCITVPFDDSHAAAEAIIKILTDANLRYKLSIQARESLQPFINYDIGGAWQKVFESLENDEPAPPVNEELIQAQNILLEENFNLRRQVEQLTNYINQISSQSK